MFVFYAVAACGSSDHSKDDYQKQKWSRFGETVKIASDAGNPLTESMSLLGLTPEDLSKPRYNYTLSFLTTKNGKDSKTTDPV